MSNGLKLVKLDMDIFVQQLYKFQAKEEAQQATTTSKLDLGSRIHYDLTDPFVFLPYKWEEYH